MPLKILFTKTIIIFIALLSGFIYAGEKVFNNVSEIRFLTHEEAEKRYKVELKAIITYAFNENEMGFLQDESAGIFFRENKGDKPELGDLVKISARTGAGLFAPILNGVDIEVIGKSALPKPAAGSINDIINGHEDSQWIGVSGVIKSVKYDNNLKSVNMSLDISGRLIAVYVQYSDVQNLPFHLLGSTVYIEGVAGADFNQKKQLLGIRLFVQDMKLLKILKPERSDPYKKEPLLLDQILQYSTSYNSEERIRIQGIVTYSTDQTIFIQDSNASVVVYTDADYEFASGDKIDIVGFAVAGEFNPEIKNALCKKIAQGFAIKPLVLDSLTSLEEIQDASFVSVDAKLLRIVNQGSYSILYLEKDSILFEAHLKNGSSGTELYKNGSIVNLSGIVRLEANSNNIKKTESGLKIPESLKIMLRNSSDILLLQPAPWFTFEKALGLLGGLGILIILSFGWVYLLKRKVTQRTQDLISSQKEKDSILQNVEEGFFLLDKNLIIQSQFSAALLDIMDTASPADKTFEEFLSPYLKKDEINVILDYVKLVLDQTIDVLAISELNPLNRMVFHFKEKNKESYLKYLTFDFKPILYQEKISGIIVTVVDETEEFKLAEKLSLSEENSNKHIEWMTSIINLDPRVLQEFINSTNSEVIDIEEKLKSIDTAAHQLLLENISRSLHLLKGNASLLELKFFALRVHQLEDLALALKDLKEIDRSDFLPLVMGIQDLKNNLDELKNLIHKLSSLNVQTSDKKITKESTILEYVNKMVKKVSKELGKEVHFDAAGFKAEIIPPQYLFVVKNIVIQLLRNSLAHGIETADERKKSNKPLSGQIKMATSVEGNNFILNFSDDGRGLQINKLKEKALAYGDWNKKEIEDWSKEDYSEVIFKSGISATDGASMISGRGVGMDLIKSQLDKHGGTIDVDFEEGKYCRFTISLPLTHTN